MIADWQSADRYSHSLDPDNSAAHAQTDKPDPADGPGYWLHGPGTALGSALGGRSWTCDCLSAVSAAAASVEFPGQLLTNTMRHNRARAAPNYEWAFSIYLVSVPILSSLLFIGRDVLQIWRRWFCCGSKRRQVVAASFVTISGLDEKKKQARLHKHISSPSSEFASRMSDIPAEWTDSVKSQEAKWRQSHRASYVACDS